MPRLGCLSSLFVGLATGCSFFAQEEADKSSSSEAVASEDAATPCDLEALRALAPTLTTEDPSARARAAWSGVHEACGDALPSAVIHAFEPPPKEAHADSLRARTDERYLALLRAACPRWSEVQRAVTSAPPSGRGMAVFEGCDFARFDVVDKETVEGTRQPTVVAFALYHWLSEMGLEAVHAKSIARSLYVAERRAEFAWLAPHSIELPIGDAPPVGESYLLYVDDKGVRQSPDGEAMVELVDGRLAEQTPPAKSFTALQVELERWAALDVMQRDTDDEVTKRNVLIVAPADTRFEVIVELVAHASLAGLEGIGIATESPDAMSVGSLRVAPRRQQRPLPVVDAGKEGGLDSTGEDDGSANSGEMEVLPGRYAMRGPKDGVPQMARDFDPDLAARRRAEPSPRVGLTIELEPTRYSVGQGAGGPSPETIDGDDFGPVSAAAKALGKDSTASAVVVVSATPDTPLKRVVDAFVAARGADCLDDPDSCGLTELQLTRAPAHATSFDVPARRGLLEIMREGADAGTVGLGNLGLVGSEPRKKIPRVRQAKSKVEGPLDRDIIRRIVRAHINEVRDCYSQGLAKDPGLAGRVVIDFEISPTGKVSTASVASTNLDDEAVGTCIQKAVERWKFPKPEGGGSVQVTYPFQLDPG